MDGTGDLGGVKRGSGRNNIPLEDELNAALQEWSKMEKSLGSNRQASSFNTTTIVYDANTGKYYYGMNKGISLSGDKANTILFGDGTVKGILPEKSLNKYIVGNCAEMDAINQALNDGARLSDLYMYTTHTTPNQFGVPKIACENCTYSIKDVIAGALSGFSN